jgi:hypothetical protein
MPFGTATTLPAPSLRSASRDGAQAKRAVSTAGRLPTWLGRFPIK